MAGAIAQSKIGEAAASGTTVATGSFGSNVTAGNYLLIITNSDTTDTVTITKNSGTATIGAVTEQGSVSEAATLEELTVSTCQITGSGSLDLLCTFGSAQSNKQILAFEISGTSGHQVTGVQTDTGNNPTTACSVTVSTQPAFAVSVCIDVQGGTPSVGTGYTDATVFGSAVHFIRAQTKAISATGTLTADFGNAGFDRTCSALAVFTDSAGDFSGPFTSPSSTQPVRRHRRPQSRGMTMEMDVREWW